MLLAVAALVGLLITLAATLLRPRVGTAWALLGFTALWLPANDQHLEGAVLVDLGGYHGITVADLLAAVGAGAATVTLLHLTRRHRPGLGPLAGTAAMVTAVLAVAAAVTYVNG